MTEEEKDFRRRYKSTLQSAIMEELCLVEAPGDWLATWLWLLKKRLDLFEDFKAEAEKHDGRVKRMVVSRLKSLQGAIGKLDEITKEALFRNVDLLDTPFSELRGLIVQENQRDRSFDVPACDHPEDKRSIDLHRLIPSEPVWVLMDSILMILQEASQRALNEPFFSSGMRPGSVKPVDFVHNGCRMLLALNLSKSELPDDEEIMRWLMFLTDHLELQWGTNFQPSMQAGKIDKIKTAEKVMDGLDSAIERTLGKDGRSRRHWLEAKMSQVQEYFQSVPVPLGSSLDDDLEVLESEYGFIITNVGSLHENNFDSPKRLWDPENKDWTYL